MSDSSNQVHVGMDGWLFLMGGSNDARRLFCDEDSITLSDIQNWRNLLQRRRLRLNSMGTKYVHSFIPDKLSVYGEKTLPELGLRALSPSQLIIGDSLRDTLRGVVVDLLPAMLEAKNDRMLYWKTDTHWTFAGACAAHKVLCDALEAIVPEQLYERPEQEATLTLDLGSKLIPPVTEVWSAARVLRNAKLTYKNPLVRFLEMLRPSYQGQLHIGASVGFENKAASCDPRRVLIFGDSFCEYRPHSLTGLFAETFKELRFVWSNSIDYGLVEAIKPDIVFSLTAERFLKRMPEDILDTEKVAYASMTTFLNQHCSEEGGPRFDCKSAAANTERIACFGSGPESQPRPVRLDDLDRN